MSKKQPVLCVYKPCLENVKKLTDIPETGFHLLNRHLVDGKDITIGEQFPQIIPLIALYQNGRYLTYERQGSEERLHNKKSLTLGGHVDIEDIFHSSLATNKGRFHRAVCKAAIRELKEEVGLEHWFDLKDFQKLVYVPEDDVSKVHVGLLCVVPLMETQRIENTDEVRLAIWKTKEEILEEIDDYELWSQFIINTYL